jgi:hypothetical protein
MEKIYFILLLLGAVCFLFSALSHRWPEPWTVRAWSLMSLGLLFWIFVPLIQTAKHM